MAEEAQEIQAEELENGAETEETVNPDNDQETGEEQEQEQSITLTQKELDDKIRRETKKAAAIAERKTRQRLMAEFQAQTTAQVIKEIPAPKRSDFQDEDAYIDARIEYKEAIKANEVALKSERQFVEIMQQKAEELLDEAEEFPEFDRDLFLSTPFTDAMNDFVLDSEKGAKILAYLSSNPDEQERIAKIKSPVRQIAEMTKIEDKVSVKPVTKDAKPIDSVKGSNVSKPNPGNFKSQKEYEAWRLKNGRPPLWARSIHRT